MPRFDVLNEGDLGFTMLKRPELKTTFVMSNQQKFF
jgi:hypothetical protein